MPAACRCEVLCDGVPERVVAQLIPARPDDLEAVGKLPRGVQRGQRRQEVAAGEVAGGAEEDQRLDHRALTPRTPRPAAR